MFVSPIDKQRYPGKRAWENYTIYHNGAFYAFFATGTPSESDSWGRPIHVDIATSVDGVRWRFIARDILTIEGAHAGFGVAVIGGDIMYYPTCSDRERGVHFKVYRSRDMRNWEHLGDDRDVTFDRRFYDSRWDEMHVLAVREDGRDVYYGYISSVVREENYAPSCGLLKSDDGVSWEVLPPPVIEWGELPAQHMELNFCEHIDGRYYLSMSGRYYLDSYGYSLYTFVGDSPRGPFRPDREMFRLCGSSRHSVTWLGHTVNTPEGLLVALWLSARQPHDLPSDNFGVGPLKRLACEQGHLRLRYWHGNERAKGPAARIDASALQWVHPSPALRGERDGVSVEPDAVEIRAARDGALLMIEPAFDAGEGFMFEATVCARERGRGSHQNAAAAGLFFESASGQGRAMIADTLGVTRSGTLRYGDHRISDEDVYAHCGSGLVSGRSGSLRGICGFDVEDTVGPFGHASFCGIRHDCRHHFRLIARGEYFELYVDDYYVQTFLLPVPFSGRIGLLAFDGSVRFEAFKAWSLNL